jgi:hypothetical protein
MDPSRRILQICSCPRLNWFVQVLWIVRKTPTRRAGSLMNRSRLFTKPRELFDNPSIPPPTLVAVIVCRLVVPPLILVAIALRPRAAL